MSDLDKQEYGFEYRPDGMFWCRTECTVCGCKYLVLAVSPWRDKCDTCLATQSTAKGDES